MMFWKKPKANETSNAPNKQSHQSSRLAEVHQELASMQKKAEESRAEMQEPDYQQKQWEKRERWSREKSLVLLQKYVSNAVKAEGVPVN